MATAAIAHAKRHLRACRKERRECGAAQRELDKWAAFLQKTAAELQEPAGLFELGKRGKPMNAESLEKLVERAIAGANNAQREAQANRARYDRSAARIEAAVESLREARQRAAEAGFAAMDDYLDSFDDCPLKSQDLGDFADGGGADFEPLKDLTAAELPLRLVFLDKSGSMGCEHNSFNALCLAADRALAPQTGSCLLFLMAGPGETQIYFSKAGHPNPPEPIRLGASTWFNEPVFIVLKALAPVVEQLDLPTHRAAIPAAAERGQPPIQVIAITDGQDNCSPEFVARLPQLADCIGLIEGPASGRQVYLPLGGWRKNHQDLAEEAVQEGKVPVWLTWVTVSQGAEPLLAQAKANKVAVLDARPPQHQPGAVAKAAPDPPDPLLAVRGCVVGASVTASVEGRRVRGVVVTVDDDAAADEAAGPDKVEVLLLGAAAGQTLQLPTDELTLDLPVEPPSVAQPPAELVPVGMVEACFVRPGAVLAMVGHDGVVRADRCGQLVDQGLTARIARAKGALPVAPVPADPLPPGFVLGFLQALAPAAARLQGPAERQAANSLLVAAAGQLLRELPQEPAIDAAKQPSAALRRAMAGAGLLASTEAGITRATVVAGTLDAMMEYLTRAGAVEATAVAGRGDCGRSSCTACGGGAGSGGPAGWVLVQARRRCGAAIAALLASPAINVVEAAIGQQRQQLLPSSAAQQPRVLARATLRRPKAAVAQPSACWLLDLATPVVAAGGGGGERRSPLPLLPSRAACASSRGHRR